MGEGEAGAREGEAGEGEAAAPPRDHTRGGPKDGLKEVIQDALDCPCVADLKEGPCGLAFVGAFSCYVEKSDADELTECTEKFVVLQECMVRHPEDFQELADYVVEKGKESKL